MVRLWKNGYMTNLSQIVPFFSDFPPISYQFHTFFLHTPECIFGDFSQFLILLYFPPFPPLSPRFLRFPLHFTPMTPPFFHFPHFSDPLRLAGKFGYG